MCGATQPIAWFATIAPHGVIPPIVRCTCLSVPQPHCSSSGTRQPSGVHCCQSQHMLSALLEIHHALSCGQGGTGMHMQTTHRTHCVLQHIAIQSTLTMPTCNACPSFFIFSHSMSHAVSCVWARLRTSMLTFTCAHGVWGGSWHTGLGVPHPHVLATTHKPSTGQWCQSTGIFTGLQCHQAVSCELVWHAAGWAGLSWAPCRFW